MAERTVKVGEVIRVIGMGKPYLGEIVGTHETRHVGQMAEVKIVGAELAGEGDYPDLVLFFYQGYRDYCKGHGSGWHTQYPTDPNGWFLLV